MPRGTKAFDWEIELAAVIGKTARYVAPRRQRSRTSPATRSRSTCRRAISIRRPISSTNSIGSPGKATDTCCPLGPWIVPAAAIRRSAKVALKLSVNGEVKQDSNTDKMIYSVAEQIARASEIMTLDPGDVILTGTPAGVGVPKSTFLKLGDRIDAEIAGIGTLSVTIARQGLRTVRVTSGQSAVERVA